MEGVCETTRVWGYDNLYLSLSRSIAKTGHQTCRNEPDATILEYYKVSELSLPPSLSLVLLFWTLEITVQIYHSSSQLMHLNQQKQVAAEVYAGNVCNDVHRKANIAAINIL